MPLENKLSQQAEWAGQPLASGAVALVPFFVPGKPGEIMLVVAAVESQGALVSPPLLGEFVAAHADRQFVCIDAAAFFGAANSLLCQDEESGRQRLLWQFAEQSQLIDVRLLECLIADASEGSYSGGGAEELSANYHAPELTSISLLEQQLLTGASRGIAKLDRSLVNEAISVAAAVFKVLLRQVDPVRKIMARAEIPESQAERFGPLGIGTQVQAEIVAHYMEKNRWQIDPERFDGVLAELESERDRIGRAFVKSSDVRQCFKVTGGTLALHNGRPHISQKRLRDWLTRRKESLIGDHQVPLPTPHENDANLSTVPERWGILRDCDRDLHHWSEMMAVCNAIRCLKGVRTGDFSITYEVLPRLRASAPSADALRILRERELLAPDSHGPLFAIKLRDLELLALAATCERRFGRSELANKLRCGEDVVGQLAQRLTGPRAGNRTVARSLIDGVAFELGTDVIGRMLKERHGFRPSVREGIKQVFQMCPELKPDTARTTISALAEKLGGDPQDWRNEILSYPIPEIHRAIANYRPSKQTKEVFATIVRISKKLIVAGPEFYHQIFGRTWVGVCGRVRKGYLYAYDAAPHLDLADDVRKRLAFSLLFKGLPVLCLNGNEIWLDVGSGEEDSKKVVQEVAQETGRQMLGGLPIACDFTIRRQEQDA